MTEAAAPAPMSPEEYRDCLGKLDLTQNGAGRFLGVATVTARKWAAVGGEGPPAAVAKLLRYMVAAKLTPEKMDGRLASYRYRRRAAR